MIASSTAHRSRAMKLFVVQLLLAVLLVFLTSSLASAQVVLYPDLDTVVVDEIRLRGNKRNSDEDLLYYIKQQRGKRLDLDIVSADIKRLYKMKLYDDIQVDLDNEGGRSILTYYFIEKPAIAEIRIEGNREIKKDDLMELLDIRAASPLDEEAVNRNLEKLRAHYAKEGYFLAEVRSRVETLQDNNVDVIFDVKEYDKVKVKRITINGNKALSDKSIKEHIFTREESLKGLLTKAGEYSEDEYKKDLQRVAGWYAENGYPLAKVTDSHVRLSPDRRSIYISLTVEEGEYVTIDDVEVTGDFIGDKEELEALLSVKSGQSYKLSQLFDDVQAIQDYYGDRGYAYANVEPLRLEGSEPNTMSINYSISKGQRVKIGKIRITGNVKTADKVIRREVLVNEGEYYRGRLVRNSESSILRTGYFEKASVTTQAAEDPNYINILVEVTERSTGSFQIGAGFSSSEKFIGTLQISYDNFLGRGQFLSAQGTISSLRQLFNIQFFDPYFIDSLWRFRASIFNYEYEYTDFTRSSYGGNLGFGYPFTRDLTLDLTYTIENVKVSTNHFGSQQRKIGDLMRGGLTSSVNATLTWDKRNNRLLPTSGFMLQASADVADEYIGSQTEYVRLVGRGRAYFNVFWHVVLKFNLELGLIANWNGPSKEIPVFERFFVGGPNSVRGFERGSLGPTRSYTANLSDPASSLTKLTIGGDKQLVFNAELEVPILASMGISAVAFFDMGNAFNEDQNLSLKIDWFANEKERPSTLRSAMGFGLRWMSPMGLLRFEWGFPLKPMKSEEKYVFEFSIGNAF